MDRLILQEIHLYSLPLSPLNNNVYDKSIYTLFTGETLLTSEVKNRILIHIRNLSRGFSLNKNEVLTLYTADLEGTKLQHITKANYCMVKVSGSFYYYFITEYVSNANNGSITFSLQWDSWQNNLDEIKKIQPQLVSRFTPNDAIVEGDVLKPYYKGSFESFDYKDYTSIQILKDGMILWERLIVDKECPIGITNSILSPLKLLYRPYCVLNKDTTIKVSASRYCIRNLDETINQEYQDYSFTSTTFLEGDQELSTYILSRAITIMGIGTPLYYEVPNQLPRVINGFNSTATMEKYTSIDSKPLSLPYYSDTFFSSIEYDTFEINLNKSRNIDISIIENTPIPFNDNRFNTYDLKSPFYNIDIYGASKLDKSPFINDEKIRITLTKENGFIPAYSISGKSVTNRFKVNPPKETIINRDSLSEFMRNNAYSFNTSNALSILSAIVGGFTPSSTPIQSITSIARGATTALNSIMRVEDIDHSVDAITNTSSNLTSPIYETDIPIIVETQLVDEIRESVLYDLNVNGVFCYEVRDIFSVNRVNFDFIQIEDPLIDNLEIDYEDKNIIYNIFKNGVRIWHPDKTVTVGSSQQTAYLMKFDLYNFPMNIIEELS